MGHVRERLVRREILPGKIADYHQGLHALVVRSVPARSPESGSWCSRYGRRAKSFGLSTRLEGCKQMVGYISPSVSTLRRDTASWLHCDNYETP